MGSQVFHKLKAAQSLPSPAGVALELLRLTGDENATVNAVTLLVESDPALAGRLLKLVNSPFAGTSRRVASISMAVRLLGMRTIKSLALALSLIANHRKGQCGAFNYELFWSESLARAVAARAIASRCRNFPPDDAFTAALLSQIGRLALASGYSDEYTRVLGSVDPTDPQALLGAERAAFATDHYELSAEMMEEWRLTEAVCQGVRYLSESKPPGSDPNPAGRLCGILRLASAIASLLAVPPCPCSALGTIETVAADVGVSRESLDQFFDEIGAEWRDVGAVFSVSTREVTPLEQLRARAPQSPSCPPQEHPKDAPPVPGAPPPRTDPPHVLVVDDDPAALRLLERQVSAAGYRVTAASGGGEALDIERSQGPRMIITDWAMPGIGGAELCRTLRERKERGFVYIIVLTASTDRVVEALESGADDFLPKPYNREELLARIRAGERILHLEAAMAERSRELAHSNAQLAAANQQLSALATTDELTGLVNRRGALTRLAEQWSLSVRSGEPLSCIAADIDFFKLFNDRHGHATGDAALKATADTLRSFARDGEAACRMGGEEFLIICPRTSVAAAAKAAERLRLAVARQAITCNGTELAITLSLGVAQRSDAMQSINDLLSTADQALYAAKQAGRNCVRIAASTPEPDAPCPTASVARRPPAAALDDGGSPPARVLIADDDPDSRALCRRILERDGHEVCEAADGLEALRKVPACLPDVIVMDVMMPNLDGLECTRRLKAGMTTKDIPIIMLSAAADDLQIVRGLEAGADEYISKPFRHREFALRIRSMARLHRGIHELIGSTAVRWEQTRTLQTLLDLSSGLVGADELDVILEKTLFAAAELSLSRHVSILLPEPGNIGLGVAKSVGPEPAVITFRGLPGTHWAERAFATAKPLVMNGPADHTGGKSLQAGAALVSLPMLAGGRSVGVLMITGREEGRPFSPGELEALELLCNLAATAIDDLLSRTSRDRARDSVVMALATLAEHRDVDTGRHLERVTRYALMIAGQLRRQAGFSAVVDDEFLEALQRAMPLHDIGKVAIPDRILLKPGRLTAEERAIMQRHAALGARTVQSIIDRGNDAGFLVMAKQIAGSHHEWYDGTGYPHGLRGDQIPLAARIAAVADVYDALCSRRPYKDAQPTDEVSRMIGQASGTHFDPAVVEAFQQCERRCAEVAAELADPQAGDGQEREQPLATQAV